MSRTTRLVLILLSCAFFQGCASTNVDADNNTAATTTTTSESPSKIDKLLSQLQQPSTPVVSQNSNTGNGALVQNADGQVIIENLPVEQPTEGGKFTKPKKPSGSNHLTGIYERVETNKKFVALTFDDGPHVKNTPKLLDILKRKGVKATFFIVGQRAGYYPKIIQRIGNEGHELGNHSWEHKNFLTIGSAALRRSLSKTHEAVRKQTGKNMKVMRPPYGAYNARVSGIAQNEFGYKIIMWDVDPLDWKKPGIVKVRNRIVRGSHNGSIILAHDIHASTVAAIPTVIDRLKSKGYQFVTVSRLIRESKSGAKDSDILLVSL